MFARSVKIKIRRTVMNIIGYTQKKKTMQIIIELAAIKVILIRACIINFITFLITMTLETILICILLSISRNVHLD